MSERFDDVLFILEDWKFVLETSMGTSVNAQSDSGSDYAYRVKEMCRIVIERSTSIIKSNDFLYSFSKDSKKEHEAIKILHDYTKSVIRKRKEELIKKNSEVADDSGGTRKRLTLLDLLLTINVRDSRLITEEEIREEVDTFMFAVSFYKCLFVLQHLLFPGS